MVVTALSDEALLCQIRKLPVAPRLLVSLTQAMRSSRTHASEIILLLRQDPSLVARIISMANSVAYAREEPVGSIEEALSCIGFREAIRLVGVVAASQLADHPGEMHGLDGRMLRENSVFVAVLMEELAGYAGEDPGASYTIGLLRSIGKLALRQLALREPGTPDFANSGESELDIWEEKVWGLTNCELAGRILEIWRLPHETVLAIRHHYRPARLHNPMIHLLNLAAGTADQCGYGLPGEASFWEFTPENFTKAALSPGELQGAVMRAKKTFQRLQQAAR